MKQELLEQYFTGQITIAELYRLLADSGELELLPLARE